LLLVDTSVWVEFFRADSDFDLESVLEMDEVVTCPPVVQEVLQGFRDAKAYRRAREAMLAFPIVESPMELEVFEEACDLYRTARRVGVTVRSSIDCLIAVCAIRNLLTVLHLDRDFDLLTRTSPLRARSIAG